MNASQPALAAVLAELATVGRKLVESSERALALLERGEAECLSRGREPVPETTMPTVSPLLTRDETIAVLRVGERSFGRLRSDPAKKFPQPVGGRPLRWRRGDVEKWLARSSR